MKASKLNDRARSLADMPNADFITYEDELNSLNESWKDVYSKLTEQDEDYFILEKEYPVSSDNKYLLPSDMYKIRTVDVKMGDKYYIVNKFALSSRNNIGIKYRISGKYLIITGNKSYDVRITYYPPPEYLSLPDVSITYSQNLPTVNNIYENWAVVNSSKLIFTEDNICYEIEENDDTPNELFTQSSDITYPMYYKNSILFIEGGELKRRMSDGAISTLVDMASGGIAPDTYRPSLVRDTYYFTPVAETSMKSYDLIKGVINIFDTSQLYDSLYTSTIGDHRYYLSTNAYGITSLKMNSDTIVHQGVDMFSYPFFTVDDIIYRLNEDDTFNEWGKGTIGYNGKYSLITGDPFTGSITTIGNAKDSSIDYPLNIVPEIMSYSMALDYTRKAQGDPTLIKTRLGELWMRFEEVVKRDDYEAEVISGSYPWRGNYGE